MSFEEDLENKEVTQEQEIALLESVIERCEEDYENFLEIDDLQKRYFAICSASKAAFMLGKFEVARELADETLVLSEEVPKCWNYGNCTYYANWVLGMLALEDNDVVLAKSYLIKAGNSKGSPQLNTFGPNMLLAKKLLRAGEKEAVLEFIDSIEKFWKSGDKWLPIWRKKIIAGEIPHCLMHLS